jgi:hypothetical protein
VCMFGCGGHANSHVPTCCPKNTMNAKTMSLGMKLSKRKTEMRVFNSPQMNESSSTGKIGVKPNIT